MKLQQLAQESLFLQPPHPHTEHPLTVIRTLLDSLHDQNEYQSFVDVAVLSRQCIVDYYNKDDQGDRALYTLWETHLTALIFAMELSLAQRESKKLCTIIEALESDKQPQLQIPFSLRLLLLRLKSQGPGSQALNDYYTLLWQLRQKFKDSNDKVLIRQKMTALSYGVGATLIAKREYATFLTLAKTIPNSFNMQILSVVISIMNGDWPSVEFSQLEQSTLEQFSRDLSTVLKTTNPILDHNKPDTGIRESINLTTLDDLFELVKAQRITGRIVCALCSLFELQMRTVNGHDLFRDGSSDTEEDGIMDILFTMWDVRTSKLYAFE